MVANHHRGSIAAIAKATPQAKKLAQLRKKEAERKARLSAQIDSWFTKFDFNEDGKLQREELRALLTWLQPDRPPTEDNLDFLLEKATAIESFNMRIPGDKNGAVSWHQARSTVEMYHEYCRDQKYLDSVFSRFDADDNGTLDLHELPALLQEMAPEGVVVDASDAKYVLEQCDSDGDGVISRDEVMPMLARWKQVAAARHAHDGDEPSFGEALFSRVSQSFRRSSASESARVSRSEVVSSRWSLGARLVQVNGASAAGADGKQKLGSVIHAAGAAVTTAATQERWKAQQDETLTLQECSSPPSHASPEPSTGSSRAALSRQNSKKSGAKGATALSRSPSAKAAGPEADPSSPEKGATGAKASLSGSDQPATTQAKSSSMCVLL